MQTTAIDRRTVLKITLAGASAALLPPLAMASAEHAPYEASSTQSFVAPAMCAELHIEDTPDAVSG